MSFLWRALAVFVGMTLLDISFAIYVIKAAQREAFVASIWASMIQVFNVFVVSSFVRDRRLAVPSVLGAFAGTWVAVAYF